MKTLLTTLLFVIFSTLHLSAQEFSIKGIEKLPTDMDARVNFARKDQNGKTCAIIKIATPLTGFSFDTGTLSVQYVVEKTGEIWVYVQPGVKKITIAHQTLGVVREWDIPIKIEEACSYALTLNTPNETGTRPQIENPQRTTLLSLRKNERLCTGECFLTFKSDGYHYVCLITDTLLKKDYLMVDGTKRVIADEISANYLDPYDFNKSIFQFKDDGNWSFFIEGETYGPYSGKHASLAGGWGSSNSDWIKKGQFSVYNASTKQWTSYLYGKPYKRKKQPWTYDTYSENFKSDTAQSVNNKYKVFSTEFGTITYNGVKHRVLPRQTFNSDWRQGIDVLDDGRCTITFYQKGHPKRVFIFDRGKVSELSQNQYFNYRTNKIESGEDEYGIFTQSIYSWPSDYYKKQLRVLHDDSERHTLETCALYNYVLVDNKEYGSESAIFIRYDKQRNEFQWIALESKELVMYQYRL